MKLLKFPDGFLWGGAQAAEQAEGSGKTGKGDTQWDAHFKKDPKGFYQGVDASVTSDFINKYKDDLKLWNEIGANSIRTSFSWARIFPDDTNTPSKEGVKFYHDMLAEAKKNNIKVVMTLFHFDMPLWAADKGGWESTEVIDKFAEFADYIFGEYKDEVHMYATMNEPIVPIYGGYLYKFHWPLVEDEARAFQASYGTILAHAKAVNVFNAKYRSKLKAKIGVVINVAPSYPKDGINFTPEDAEAARINDIMHNHSFLGPMLKGEFPKELIQFVKDNPELMPKHTKSELEEIKKVKVDFVGVNFYAPSRQQAPKADHKPKFKNSLFSQGWGWKDAVMNVFRGWEIYPKALYDTAKLIRDEYDNIPFYISENGMGVQDEHLYKDDKGVIQDDYRIAFLNEHLYWVHKAIEEGANCFGYHMWAIMDNWSWKNAYKNRYGFVSIDLETQKRTPKKSAEWLKFASDNNAIPAEFKKVQEVMDLTKVKFEKSI